MKAKNKFNRTAKKNPGHARIQAPRTHAAKAAPNVGGEAKPIMKTLPRRHELSTFQPPTP